MRWRVSTRSSPRARPRSPALQAEQHGHEKSIVGFDAQSNRTSDELARVQRRLDVVTTERHRADEEERATALRRDEAMAAIELHETQQRDAEARLGTVMGLLQSARGDAEALARNLTIARTEQAGTGRACLRARERRRPPRDRCGRPRGPDCRTPRRRRPHRGQARRTAPVDCRDRAAARRRRRLARSAQDAICATSMSA